MLTKIVIDFGTLFVCHVRNLLFIVRIKQDRFHDAGGVLFLRRIEFEGE